MCREICVTKNKNKMRALLLLLLFGSCVICNACHVSEWSAWSACSVECSRDGGVQTRTRTVLPPGASGEQCPVLVEERACRVRRGCYLADEAPYSHDTHKLRVCDAMSVERARFSSVTDQASCFRTPCPIPELMAFNAQPCFNVTHVVDAGDPWSGAEYLVADRANLLGFYDTLLLVNYTATGRVRPCTPAERVEYCGGTNVVGCLTASDSALHPTLGQCREPPSTDIEWSMCPARWIAAYGCYADERRCVWSINATNSTALVQNLMRFDCPWSNYTQSNVAPDEWSRENWMDCTSDESERLCGQQWRNQYNAGVCRKRYVVYNEVGGHEYEYDTNPCELAPCTGAQQLVRCGGNYSHFCRNRCDRYGNCIPVPELSTCNELAPIPARECKASEIVDSCVDPAQVLEQCRVVCASDTFDGGCQMQTRCEGETEWEFYTEPFARERRLCTQSERQKHACTDFILDCLVECDNVQAGVNCTMLLRCPSSTPRLVTTTTVPVYATSSEALSVETCGDLWLDDPLRERCDVDWCSYGQGGVLTQCSCNVTSCVCPYTRPSEESQKPCAASSAITRCPTSSVIAQQTCGVLARDCVTNCTGLVYQQECSPPNGNVSQAQCECASPGSGSGEEAGPLYGLPCNGVRRACTSWEWQECGSTSVECYRVTEVFVGVGVGSLRDPDSGAVDGAASYVQCLCHPLATLVENRVSDTGDATAFCGGSVPVTTNDTLPLPPSSMVAVPQHLAYLADAVNPVAACTVEEAELVCGNGATTCTKQRFKNFDCLALRVDAALLEEVSEDDDRPIELCMHRTGVLLDDESADEGFGDDAYHWEVITGTCRCNTTISMELWPNASYAKNGPVCSNASAEVTECSPSDVERLGERFACSHSAGGICTYDCTLVGGCVFNASRCYPDASPYIERVCTDAERLRSCSAYARECDASFWWPGSIVPSPKAVVGPRLVEGTQVCDVYKDDLVACTLHDTVSQCTGVYTGAKSVDPPTDDRPYRYDEDPHAALDTDFVSIRLCRKFVSDGLAVQDSCPGIRTDVRTCNLTQRYLFCPEHFPVPPTAEELEAEQRDNMTAEALDNDHVCLVACRDVDLVAPADRVADCVHVGMCVAPNTFMNVSDQSVLYTFFGSDARYYEWCVMRVIADAYYGYRVGGEIVNATADCEFDSEAYELDHLARSSVPDEEGDGECDEILGCIEDDGDGDGDGEEEEAEGGGFVAMRKQQKKQQRRPYPHDHLHAVSSSPRGVIHSAFHPRHAPVHMIQHEVTGYRHEKHVGRRYGRRGGRAVATAASVFVSEGGVFAVLATGTTNISDGVTQIHGSTEPTHLALCGPPGSTVGVDVIVSTVSAPPLVQVAGTCECNITAQYYAVEGGSRCRDYYTRDCTESEKKLRPAACKGACTLECKRTAYQGIIFGVEACYAFGGDATCFDRADYIKAPLDLVNQLAICGNKSLSGTGYARWNRDFPVPVQTVVTDMDSAQKPVCVCSDPAIKFPLDGKVCGSTYYVRECLAADRPRLCGVYVDNCDMRCTQANKVASCYEADWCTCKNVPASLNATIQSLCVERNSEGLCTRFKNCGLGTLDLSTTVNQPSCDFRGVCGPLTASASFLWPFNKPLDECQISNRTGLCDPAVTRTTCQCKSGGVRYGGVECGGFSKRCEPRELWYCAANEGACIKPLPANAKNAVGATQRVFTSCQVACQVVGQGGSRSMQCPLTQANLISSAVVYDGPLPAGAQLRDRGIPFLVTAPSQITTGKNVTALVHVKPTHPQFAVLLGASLNAGGTIPCTQSDITTYCIHSGVPLYVRQHASCSKNRFTTLFINGSCTCTNIGGTPQRTVAQCTTSGFTRNGAGALTNVTRDCVKAADAAAMVVASPLLSDQGHECRAVGHSTYTIPCPLAVEREVCGYAGVKSCKVVSQTPTAVDATYVNSRCECFDNIMEPNANAIHVRSYNKGRPITKAGKWVVRVVPDIRLLPPSTISIGPGGIVVETLYSKESVTCGVEVARCHPHYDLLLRPGGGLFTPVDMVASSVMGGVRYGVMSHPGQTDTDIYGWCLPGFDTLALIRYLEGRFNEQMSPLFTQRFNYAKLRPFVDRSLYGNCPLTPLNGVAGAPLVACSGNGRCNKMPKDTHEAPSGPCSTASGATLRSDIRVREYMTKMGLYPVAIAADRSAKADYDANQYEFMQYRGNYNEREWIDNNYRFFWNSAVMNRAMTLATAEKDMKTARANGATSMKTVADKVHPSNRLLVSPLAARVAFQTWGYSSGDGFDGPGLWGRVEEFPWRLNGYCVFTSVPHVYTKNVKTTENKFPKNAAVMVPRGAGGTSKTNFVEKIMRRSAGYVAVNNTNYINAPRTSFMPNNQRLAHSSGGPFVWPEFPADTVASRVWHESNQLYDPAGHPFQVQWMPVTGAQVKNYFEIAKRKLIREVCIRGMLKKVESGLFLRHKPSGALTQAEYNATAGTTGTNADRHRRWQEAQAIHGTRYFWAPNTVQPTYAPEDATVVACLALLATYDALQNKTARVKESDFADDRYYFVAEPLGPFRVGDGLYGNTAKDILTEYRELASFACVLGPGIPPPAENDFCHPLLQTRTDRIFTKHTSFDTKNFYGAAVGALYWRASGAYECGILRPFDVIRNLSSSHIPCVGELGNFGKCVCNLGYIGDDCSVFEPDVDPIKYPLFHVPGRCGHGTLSLAPVGANSVQSVCTCHKGWALTNRTVQYTIVVQGVSVELNVKQCLVNTGCTNAYDDQVGRPLCSGHGVCSDNVLCVCDVGYAGLHCNSTYEAGCPSDSSSVICGNKGVCVQKERNSTLGVCMCHQGAYGEWTGAQCQTPKFYPESATRCSTATGGKMVSDGDDTLDIYCNCTNPRYTGEWCDVDRCPRAGSGAGAVCSGRSGSECYYDTAKQQYACRIPDAAPALARARYRGCALEYDVNDACIYDGGAKICGLDIGTGNARCKAYLPTSTRSLLTTSAEFRCECGANESGAKCERDVCMGPGVTNVSCSNAPNATCSKVKAPFGCTCKSDAPANGGSLFVGPYCQYNVTAQCGYAAPGAATRNLCNGAGSGTCVCSTGLTNGTHCVGPGARWQCQCKDGFGGEFCQGTCTGSSCATINVCPSYCGEYGECKPDAALGGTLRCVCAAGSKWVFNSTTGQCTVDSCANGWDTNGGVGNAHTLPVAAHVNPDNHKECVCDEDDLYIYKPGWCKTPRCPVGPLRGTVCGDANDDYELRLQKACKNQAELLPIVGGEREKALKKCDETDGVTRRCFDESGTCQCNVAYTGPDPVTGLCTAICNVTGTLKVSKKAQQDLECFCKTNYYGSRCNSFCDVASGRAKYLTDGTCGCLDPYATPPFCVSTDCGNGTFNPAGHNCTCPGVLMGARCEAHGCGANGRPNATDLTRCVCDFGWAGDACSVRLCPVGVSTPVVVNATIVCNCSNPDHVYNATTKTCVFAEPPPPPVVVTPPEERENVTMNETVLPPRNETLCDPGAYEVTGVECECNATMCVPPLPPPVTPPPPPPPPPEEEEEEEEEEPEPEEPPPNLPDPGVPDGPRCLNDGVLMMEGTALETCDCTGTQFEGERCEYRRCANGCTANWTWPYAESGVNGTDRDYKCLPPSDLHPYQRDWSNAHWNCTVSACGPGGRVVSSVTVNGTLNVTCVCNAGYVHRVDPSIAVRCVRQCLVDGVLYYHPLSGSCVCRPGYTGAQCGSFSYAPPTLRARYVRIQQYELSIFTNVFSYAVITEDRHANETVVEIPADIQTLNETRSVGADDYALDWFLIDTPALAVEPEPRPPIPVSGLSARAALIVMITNMVIVAAVVIGVNVILAAPAAAAATAKTGYQSIPTAVTTTTT